MSEEKKYSAIPAVKASMSGKTGDDFFDAGADSELAAELAVLTEKCNTLEKFITCNPRYANLTNLPKHLLVRQLVAMENLKEVLSDRIIYLNSL